MIPFEQARINIRNNSGETIPAFGICRMGTFYGSDSDGRPIMNVEKPDGDTAATYLVVYGSDMIDEAFGVAVRICDAIAVMINTDEPPSPTDIVGPTNDQWYASSEGTGLVIVSSPSSTGVCGVVASCCSGGIELSHGVILEVCNAACSTYRVQRIHRYLTPNCDDESGSGS